MLEEIIVSNGREQKNLAIQLEMLGRRSYTKVDPEILKVDITTSKKMPSKKREAQYRSIDD